MRIFLSFSFREEDHDLVNVVERILASHGARIVSGQTLAGENISEAIKRCLQETDALVALFTRRDLLADGTWTTHAWVRDEYVYVRSINKPALALVEDGVEGGGATEGTEFITLDRKAPLPTLLALSEVLGRWRGEFSPRHQDVTPPARERLRSSQRQTSKTAKRKAGLQSAKREQAPRIFVNYRRENAQGRGGRLADNLRLFLGDRNVFFDQDDIPPGVDFVAESLRAVADSCLLLAVIGKDWAFAKDDFGSHRLTNPADLVRRELETAIEHNLPIIPVLIDGAAMPREDQLPTELQGVARRNAMEIRDTRWTYDIRYVAEKLAEQLGVEPRFKREG
ncbi:MAG: toll/interleukin-1 receptor domain-containing protein [Nitrospira sp.]|nr:toll/interleukin-1 receptor domain-containing protein [Nitrospira sp.]